MNVAALHPALANLAAASSPAPVLPNLLGLTLTDVEHLCADLGQPRYRAEQIVRGLWSRRVRDLSELTTLPKTLRDELAARFDVARPKVDKAQRAADGTCKYRFVAHDGEAFEAVYIPHVAKSGKTNTLCVSSQTGCAVGCRFCFTASIKRHRNLAAAEIVGQVLAVQDDQAAQNAALSNIVFMGMGEPLLNYDEVVRSIRILTHPSAMNFSTRRVTVSTSGIVPRIYDLGRDVATQLAVSLNATTDDVRSEIMPINRKWPIAELLAALRAFPLPPRRRFTIEYVLLRDLNDSLDDARRLVRLLADIPVKVNLLPLNPHDRTPYAPPTAERVQAFHAELTRRGISCFERTARGQEIAAACGQLGETVAA